MRRPLGPLDATWLHLDRPDNPMVITAVLQLGPGMSYPALRDALAVRMVGRFPALRQRLEEPGARRPHWVDEPAFDLERHLVRATLIPGASLEDLTAERAACPLDLTAPPWELALVDGVGEGSALVARFHHALADGMALARVLLAMTDEGDPTPLGPPAVHPESPAASSLDPAHLAELLTLSGGAAAELERLLALPADPVTALRGPLTTAKGCGWTPPLDLARVKAIGRAHGATVNDLLLAALAGAVRAELGGAGVPALRAYVPVDLRGGDPVPADLGNRFGFVIVTLPVGLADPLERLAAVRAETGRLRGSVEPALVGSLLRLVGHTPALVQRLASEIMGRKASLIVTNVPGPRDRRHLLGVPLEHLLVWVPAAGAIGVGVSLVSYAGEVRIGVAADRALIPDPGALAARIAAEVEAFSAPG